LDWDPARHPRWPADAPEHRGGQFADSPLANEYRAFQAAGQVWLRSLSRRAHPKGRWKPGRWAMVDPQAYHKEQLAHIRDSFLQNGVHPHQARQITQEIADSTTPPAVVLQNGPHRLVFQAEHSDYGAVTEMFDRLHHAAPVSTPARLLFARDIPDRHHGTTLMPSATAMFDMKIFQPPSQTDVETSMPSAGRVPWWQYVMAHEWGHVVGGDNRQLDPPMPMMQGLSAYVYRTDWADEAERRREAYAEAFAEWFFADGHPSIEAVREAALAFRWEFPG